VHVVIIVQIFLLYLLQIEHRHTSNRKLLDETQLSFTTKDKTTINSEISSLNLGKLLSYHNNRWPTIGQIL